MTRPLPTAETIIGINAQVLRGRAAVRDPGLVSSAAARPHAVTFGAEAYPSVSEKAAALLHSVICNHPFIDGNKRTAWISMRLLLAYEGLRTGLSEDEAYDLVISVAEGCSRTDIAKLAEALKVTSF